MIPLKKYSFASTDYNRTIVFICWMHVHSCVCGLSSRSLTTHPKTDYPLRECYVTRHGPSAVLYPHTSFCLLAAALLLLSSVADDAGRHHISVLQLL